METIPDRVKRGRAKLSKMLNQDGLTSLKRETLLSLNIIYDDAIRRGLYVSGVRSYKSKGEKRTDIWFSFKLGDKPRIWGVVMDKMYVIILAKLYDDHDSSYPIEVNVRQAYPHQVRHPHRLADGFVCIGASLDLLANNMPTALIPTVIQGASTVSGGYVSDMIRTMKKLGKEIPSDTRRKIENDTYHIY